MSQTEPDTDRPARWLADCPACTRGLGVIEELKDKTVQCPACGAMFSLAGTSLHPIPEEELPPTADRVVIVRAQKSRPPWYRRIHIPMWAWTLLAILVVLGAGWWAYQRLRPPPPEQDQPPKMIVKTLRKIGDDQTRHKAEITAIACNPVGTKFLAGDAAGVVKLWNLETGALEKTIEVGAAVAALVYLPDARHFLVALSAPAEAEGSTLRRYSLVDGRADQDFPVQKPIGCLAADAEGKQVLWSGTGEGTFLLLDIDSAATVQDFEGHERAVAILAFGAAGTVCASGGADKIVRLWDTTNGSAVGLFPGHKGTVTAVAIVDPTGQVLTGESERIVRSFDRNTAREQWRVPALEAPVHDLAVDVPGRWVVARAGTTQFGFWHLSTGKECPLDLDGSAGAPNPVDRAKNPITALAYWPQKNRLLIVTAAGTFEIYEVSSD